MSFERTPRNPNKSGWPGRLPACIASFPVIEDPRAGGNKLHHFSEVLFMAVSASHRLDWMDPEIRGKWRNLRSLIHVETQTTQLDSDDVRRGEVRYYISSHWVLDTAFREDHNQTHIGHAAKKTPPRHARTRLPRITALPGLIAVETWARPAA